MKKTFLAFGLSFLFFGFILSSTAIEVCAQNSITGIVFDNNRQPVSDIDIELLDEVERLIGSRKTRNGFYSFQRLSRGIYYIQIRVGGTNFKPTKIRIDLGDLNSIGGVDIKQQDIFLETDSRRDEQQPTVTGVIFAQEVSKEAKSYYEQGFKDISNNKNEAAIKNLKSAIQIFPDYFDAHEKLGEIYLILKRFEEAENVFKKATEINKKSFNSFFNLAVAQNNLNKTEEAINTLKKANEIDSNSINAHLLLGIIQRKVKNFNEAEKTLLKAKQLSNNKQADVNWQLAELFYFELKKLNEAADELSSYLKNLSKAERKSNQQKIDGVKKLIIKIRSEAKQTSD